MTGTFRGGIRRLSLIAALAGVGALMLTGLPNNASAGPTRPGGSFVVVAAGDISERCGRAQGLKCPSERTARRVEALKPRLVLALGDNQYDYGTIRSYDRFYATTWGRFKARTRPVPGNHESYDPSGAGAGYRRYFGALATPNGSTYYSYDVGNWHFVALDSNLNMARTSRQNTWLARDLAANTRGCVLAYWHHPLYSSGPHGNNPTSRPIWRTLLRAGADVVLNGHDHLYERFAPQDAVGNADRQGIRQFTVGTGGAPHRGFLGPRQHSDERIAGVYAVLELTLDNLGYRWSLVRDNGTVLDRGSAACH
jgi:hypothetical protein